MVDKVKEALGKHYANPIILKNLKGGMYNMKKITSLFIMMFLLIGTFGVVMAEEVDDVIPEAKEVGFFSNQMFKLGLAFTFDKEAKIDKILEMAERRLAEAELLAEEDPEAYDIAQKRYDDLVARAEEVLADIESEGGDEAASIDYIGRIARIENKFERHRDHADEIYTRVKERLETNNASAERLERFEMFHERALTRSDEMEARLIEKQNNAVLKHKALSEMSEEELEDLFKRIEDEEGLTEAREARFKKAEERIERLGEAGAERLERAKDRLEDANRMNEDQRERAQERLEEANNRLEEAGERAQERLENQRELAEGRAEDLKDAIENELEDRDSEAEDESDSEDEDESDSEDEDDVSDDDFIDSEYEFYNETA